MPKLISGQLRVKDAKRIVGGTRDGHHSHIALA